MKPATIFSKKITVLVTVVYCLFGCNLDDGPPSNTLIRYDLPPEIVDEVFTVDVLKITGSLEPFLDRIKQHGMRIYEGNTPPAIFYPYSDTNLDPVNFYVKNDCIYDEKYASYADSLFGDYEDEILINSEQQDDVIRATVSYISLRGIPDYPEGLDSGSGEGIASGNGNNFTIFYQVENGRFGQISYQAVWIISGTFTSNANLQPILTDVTKCMILLEKGSDPEQQMANKGTIRVFRDPKPEWRD